MIRLVVLLLGLASGTLRADLSVTDARIRLLPPGVPNTAAYFSIHNGSDVPQVLVEVQADFVNSAELHKHKMQEGMMSMAKQAEVEIAPGTTVHFTPGGLHIMLFGLKQPLQQGQSLTMKLLTKSGDSVQVVAKVVRPQPHSHH